jgi:carboxymethylenebutenolidase
MYLSENTECRSAAAALTPDRMVEIWEAHVAAEFGAHDVDATMATMVAEPYNLLLPQGGGIGAAAVRAFYADQFVHQIPPDTVMTPVSRTVGDQRIADEMLLSFTHSIVMDWLLPGIAPTHSRIEMALVVIVSFRDGAISHEHVYWDQASVLAQVGLIDPARVPADDGRNARRLRELTA